MQFISDRRETKVTARITAQPIKIVINLSAHDKPKGIDHKQNASLQTAGQQPTIEVDRHLTGKLIGQAYVRMDGSEFMIEFVPDGTISHIPANGSLSLPGQQTSNLIRRFSLFPSRSATADDRPASSGRTKPVFGRKRATSISQAEELPSKSSSQKLTEGEPEKDSAHKSIPTSTSTRTSPSESPPSCVTIKSNPIAQIVVPLKAVYAHFVELNENKENTILSIPITTHVIYRSAREEKIPLVPLEEQGRNGKIELIWESHTSTSKQEAHALKHALKQVV